MYQRQTFMGNEEHDLLTHRLEIERNRESWNDDQKGDRSIIQTARRYLSFRAALPLEIRVGNYIFRVLRSTR